MTAGTLFTEDFLAEGIDLSPAWGEVDEAALDAFAAELRAILAGVADPARLNEAQTEARIVRPILATLGWKGAFSVQTTVGGSANVSDYTLFPTPEAFARSIRGHRRLTGPSPARRSGACASGGPRHRPG